jgi:hypothetical protein
VAPYASATGGDADAEGHNEEAWEEEETALTATAGGRIYLSGFGCSWNFCSSSGVRRADVNDPAVTRQLCVLPQWRQRMSCAFGTPPAPTSTYLNAVPQWWQATIVTASADVAVVTPERSEPSLYRAVSK